MHGLASDRAHAPRRDPHDQLLTRIRESLITSSHAQAEMLDETARQLRALNETVSENLSMLKDAFVLTEKALSTSAEGAASIRRLSESVETLYGINDGLHQAVTILQEIREKSSIIHDIARKSNIVSINATIEAMRAGLEGRAFGVVAEAVADLARQSGQAALDISESVAHGLTTMQQIAEEAREHLDQNQEVSKAASSAFSELSDGIEGISSQLQTLVTSSMRQHEDTARLTRSVRRRSEEGGRITSDLIGLITGVHIIDLPPRDVVHQLDSFTVIDVRTHEEHVQEYAPLPNALCHPIGDDLPARLEPLPREAAYLFVCRSGGRSTRAARIAQQMGFRQVFNLAGGMQRMAEEGYAKKLT
ncbi:methyl-accepting chemotaxis protein [Rhodocaloribacter sp.]